MADLIEREPLLANMFPCAAKRQVEEAPAVNRWIPCSERLPEPLQNVIVCTDINTVTIAWINGEGWTFADTGGGHTENWSFADVKFWMPLPEPPESAVSEYGLKKDPKITDQIKECIYRLERIIHKMNGDVEND